MKIFVFGLPHTKTLDPAGSPFTTCPFTTNTWNLCRMMYDRGHDVVHLGVEGSAPPCTEHVSVVSKTRWGSLYGSTPINQFYNTRTDGDFAPYMEEFATNARQAIQARCCEDFEAIMCITWGGAQRAAIEGVRQMVVESGVGYNHPWADYRVYPSYAWMNFQLGKEGLLSGDKWYHCVIPHAVDTDSFGPIVEKKAAYALYIGRLQEDKGVRVACQVTKEVGLPIKIVGQGDPKPFLDIGSHVSYLSPVGASDRNDLLRKAKVLFCPTRYVEPFGYVAVEAMASGCPVISTDWGAFSETVQHGQTGYRCRTFEQFMWAVRNIDKISPVICRKWAVANYSLARVGGMYEEFFEQLLRLKGDGWYTADNARTQLDWLKQDCSML